MIIIALILGCTIIALSFSIWLGLGLLICFWSMIIWITYRDANQTNNLEMVVAHLTKVIKDSQ